MRWMFSVLLFGLFGCADRMPSAPSQITTPAPTISSKLVLVCGGQSNAAALCGGIDPSTSQADWTPALSAYGTVVGSWSGGQPIAQWADDGPLWPTLRDALMTSGAHAFVWWQGEADTGLPTGAYLSALRDLVRRARLAAGNLSLRVVIVELGPNFYRRTVPDDVWKEQLLFAQSDPRAIYISVDDLPFQSDNVHMTPAGYVAVAARIAASLR